MCIDQHTIFNSFIWFNIFILILSFLRKKFITKRYFSLNCYILILVLIVVRICFPFQFAFTKVIESKEILLDLLIFANYKIVFLCNMPIILIGVIISLVGSIILIVKKYNEYTKFKRIIKFFNSTEKFANVFNESKELVNVNRNIKIISNKVFETPAIIGIINPIIVVPDIELTHNEWLSIFSHELIHYKYKHIFVKAIIEILCVFMWWNPITYILKTEVNNILEFCTDRHLCKYFNKDLKKSYLQAIINVIENAQNTVKSPLSISLMESNNSVMEQRFVSIVTNKYIKALNLKAIVITILSICFIFASYLFLVQPAGYPTIEDYFIEGVTDNADYVVKEGNFYRVYDANNRELFMCEAPIDEKRTKIKIYGGK